MPQNGLSTHSPYSQIHSSSFAFDSFIWSCPLSSAERCHVPVVTWAAKDAEYGWEEGLRYA